MMTELTNSVQDVRDKVREGYSAIAKTEKTSCCGPSSCCSADSTVSADQLAQVIGYSPEELASLPEGANMGLSCGNPIALASLKPGDVVVDLGSGGGFDIFIAGRKVGPTGRAIGVDMTPEMLSKARRSIAVYQQQTGWDNVEFRLGEIEHLPLADNSVDVIISNCVINLSPQKPQVWKEIARVLRPGGRVSVSDMALVKPLPPAIMEMVEALIGCVAGAVLVEETRKMAEDAGLVNIVIENQSDYIEKMTDVKDPIYKKILAHLPSGSKAGDYITSMLISAQKPV
jgi:arsenite methyltransferase